MKIIFFLFSIIIFINIVQGNDNGGNSGNSKQKINDGASTSRELDQCTQCELRLIATRLVCLMAAEDIRGGDLMYLMNNQVEEMEAFYEEIRSYFALAEFGDRAINETSLYDRNRRLEYFITAVENLMKEVLEKTCTNHYNNRFYYHYNQEHKKIEVQENLSSSCDSCMCANNPRERLTLLIPIKLPKFKKPEKKFTLAWNRDSKPVLEDSDSDSDSEFINEVDLIRGKLSAEETTVYHIIPLPLISRFFRLWLEEEHSTMFVDNYFNGCVFRIFGRLRRSLQKLLLFSMKKTRAVTSQPGPTTDTNDFSFSEETVTIDILERSTSWLSGNSFIGPSNRGPFNPTFQKTGNALLHAFETGIEPIIGQYRFTELSELNRMLINFIGRASEPSMNPFERLVSGFNIFSTMALTFQQYDVTPFNVAQWTEREPLEEEISTITSVDLRIQMRFKKYWEIKKLHRRQPRSTYSTDPSYYAYQLEHSQLVNNAKNSSNKYEFEISTKLNNYLIDNYYHYKVENPVTIITTLPEVKDRWYKFVSDVMSYSLDAQSRNIYPAWSCNLSIIYQEYLFRPVIPHFSNFCDHCIDFDEFLYSKIRDPIGWNECNLNKELSAVPDWCRAWRRIRNKISIVDNNKIELDKSSYGLLPRWRSFSSKDIRTVLNWLISPNEINDKPKNHLPILPKNPFYQADTSSVDIALCMATSIVPTFLSWKWNECTKSMG